MSSAGGAAAAADSAAAAAHADAHACPLLSLDDALLQCLCARLALRDLARLRATCTRLAAAGAGALATLTTLDVSPFGRAAGGALRMAALRCGALTHLCADEVHPVTDADVAALLSRAGGSLTALQLRGLRHVSNDAMLALGRAGPCRLRELSLAGCRRVGDGGLAGLLLLSHPCGGAAASLTRLDLSDTAVSDAGVRLLGACPSLAHVALGFTLLADGVRFQFAGGGGGGGGGGEGASAGVSASRVAASITAAGICAWLRASAAAAAPGAAPLRSLALPHRGAVRGPELLAALCECCPLLGSLDVRSTRLDGAALLRAFAAAPGAACAHTLLAGTLASSCDDDDLQLLAASCVSLRALDLSNHDAVSDDGLAALAALPALEELTLVRNSRVTRAGTCALARYATRPLGLPRLKCDAMCAIDAGVCMLFLKLTHARCRRA
jgi:hypothetical protein